MSKYNSKESNKRYYQKNKVEIKRKVALYQRTSPKYRAYAKEKIKSYYKPIRETLAEFKLFIGCQICGYNKCSSALNFHHMEQKAFNFTSSKITFWTERLVTELNKCVILCANCHEELHYKGNNKW